MSEWQPIETAPKDGTEILVHDHGCVRIAFWDVARGGVWSKWPGRDEINPRHWMPTPRLPK